jgi:hypothetical protein
MDEAMKARAWAAAVAGCLMSCSAFGQALHDPTQPPASLASSAASASAGGAVVAPVSTEPRLQSVLISTRADGRRVVVINGETLRAGQRFQDAVVVKVMPTSVVLRRGKQDQTLNLEPAKVASPETPAVAKHDQR